MSSLCLVLAVLAGWVTLAQVQARRQRDEGIRLARSNESSQAIPILETVLARRSGDTEARYWLGVCRVQVHQAEKAVEDLTACVDDPDYGFRSRLLRGWVYLDMKRLDLLPAELEAAGRDGNDQKEDFLRLRSSYHMTRGSWQAALVDLDRLVAISGPSTRRGPIVQRAWCYHHLGRPREALAGIDDALCLSPYLIDLYHDRAWMDYFEGRHAEARQDAKDFITRQNWCWNGPNAPYVAFIGYFSDRYLKRQAAAQELLEQAATKLPHSSWPYPIVRYLRREIDLQQLLAEAKTSGCATEARTWAGIDLQLSGQKEEAMSCFRWVRDHGDHDYREYELALRHLAPPDGR